MNPEQHLKVTAGHLGRLAYLYVRQSDGGHEKIPIGGH